MRVRAGLVRDDEAASRFTRADDHDRDGTAQPDDEPARNELFEVRWRPVEPDADEQPPAQQEDRTDPEPEDVAARDDRRCGKHADRETGGLRLGRT